MTQSPYCDNFLNSTGRNHDEYKRYKCKRKKLSDSSVRQQSSVNATNLRSGRSERIRATQSLQTKEDEAVGCYSGTSGRLIDGRAAPSPSTRGTSTSGVRIPWSREGGSCRCRALISKWRMILVNFRWSGKSPQVSEWFFATCSARRRKKINIHRFNELHELSTSSS